MNINDKPRINNHFPANIRTSQDKPNTRTKQNLPLGFGWLAGENREKKKRESERYFLLILNCCSDRNDDCVTRSFPLSLIEWWILRNNRVMFRYFRLCGVDYFSMFCFAFRRWGRFAAHLFTLVLKTYFLFISFLYRYILNSYLYFVFLLLFPRATW